MMKTSGNLQSPVKINDRSWRLRAATSKCAERPRAVFGGSLKVYLDLKLELSGTECIWWSRNMPKKMAFVWEVAI